MKEENFKLPEGWLITQLDDDLVIDIQPGFACGVNNRAGNGFPHLRPMNVNIEGKIDLTDIKYIPEQKVDSEKRLLQYNDILFNNTNSTSLVGKTAWYSYKEPMAFSNHMTRIRCSEAIIPKYCALAIHQKWREGYFESVCNQHVSQSSVSRNILKKTNIFLPPLAEQKRIVAKEEALLARVNAARKRLEKVPTVLKRFRQSVLGAACSGRLTEDWREDSVDYPNNLEDNLSLNHPYYNLPDTWNVVNVKDIALVKGGKRLPKGHKYSDSYSRFPYIRVLDFENMTVRTDSLKYINESTRKKIERYTVSKDDVYISIAGSIGKAGLIPEHIDGANLTENAAKLTDLKNVKKKYLNFVLNAPFAQSQIEDFVTSSGQPKLALFRIEKIRIPLPTLGEQHEIVRRVEALFKLADTIESQSKAAKERVDKLTQSILAKAFRGELVPTEAELARREGRAYEPASVLLERIQKMLQKTFTKP